MEKSATPEAVHFYVASSVPEGGIYHFVFDGDRAEEKQFVPLDRPMYLEVKEGKCRAVLRQAFENGDSGLVSFDLDENGDLRRQSGILSTKGEVGCHLTATEKGVFAANYRSGSVFRTPDLLVKHPGKGAHPTRQTSAHMHGTFLLPDESLLCAVDLGVDTVFLYDLELHPVSSVRLPAGSGPRHIAFSPDGKTAFVSCELSSEVAVLRVEEGKLVYLDSVSTLPGGFAGENFPAAIRARGPFVYVTNRGHDSIAVLKTENGRLTLQKTVPCGGEYPWDLRFFGDLAMVANQRSDSVTFFRAKDGDLIPLPLTLSIPQALCIAGE